LARDLRVSLDAGDLPSGSDRNLVGGEDAPQVIVRVDEHRASPAAVIGGNDAGGLKSSEDYCRLLWRAAAALD
jgi:hypothetical protein